MRIENLIENKETKEYCFRGYHIYVYMKQDDTMFKLTLGDDYFVYIANDDGVSVTKEVASKLGYCYSSNGYVIINTMSMLHEVQRIAGCLNER